MAPTARDIIQLALKETGVIGVGMTPSDTNLNDSFILLQRMIKAWQVKRWIVPNLYEVSMPGNGQEFNLIGPGQYWNCQRPREIQAAYFKQIGNGVSINGPNSVSFNLRRIYSYENYAQLALKELESWPQFYFYDNSYPYGKVRIWPIPDSTYQIYLVLKAPIGFDIEIATGSITAHGAGYINGAYPAVPLITLTGFGSNATADVTVAGNVVTQIKIDDGGSGYEIGDQVTVDTTVMGNAGAGSVFTVNNTQASIDTPFNMPPEYEEAIHYNLTERLISFFNFAPDPFKSALAKGALNTIRKANAQVPTMSMPAPLQRNNRGSQFYIFNADAR